jgi:hypothetical protein
MDCGSYNVVTNLMQLLVGHYGTSEGQTSSDALPVVSVLSSCPQITATLGKHHVLRSPPKPPRLPPDLGAPRPPGPRPHLAPPPASALTFFCEVKMSTTIV